MDLQCLKITPAPSYRHCIGPASIQIQESIVIKMRAAQTAARLRSCLIRQRSVYYRGNFTVGDSVGALSCRGFATLPDGEALPSTISGPVKKLLEPFGAAEAAPLAVPAAAKLAESDGSSSSVNVVDHTQAATDSFGTGTATATDAASSLNSMDAGSLDAPPPMHDAANAAFVPGDAFASTSAETVTTAAEASMAVDPSTVAQVADAATTAGFSLSDTLLQPAMMILHGVHAYSGLPWWMSIGLATIAVRTAILPLTIMTMRNSAKMAALQPEIAEQREAMMEAMRSGDQSKAMAKQEKMKSFMKSAGVGPSQVLLGPMAQFPIFISFFVGVRRLAQTEPSMATGGAYWFTDLSVADPIYALPLLCGITLAAMTELGGDAGAAAAITPVMKKGLRAMAFMSVPLTYWFEAGVFCYWLPNNIYSVCFALATRSKYMKDRLGMKVDLAKIPGTRDHAKAMRQMKFQPTISNEKLGNASPAASYMMKKAIDVESVEVSRSATPQLLKYRPSSSKKKKSQRKKRNVVH